MNPRVNDEPKIISTGTEGLDEMLPSGREGVKGGFIKGSTVLLAGTPGSGKTIMGLQFLKKGKEELQEGSLEKKTGALWISFEASDKEGVKKSITTFDPKLEFIDLIESKDYFYFKHFSPAKLNFDEFVHIIAYHIDNYKIERICIDSISDIIAQFETHPIQFKSNINALCHYLTSKGVTTLFLYRMSQFFGEVERMGVEIISMVDTILAMKNIEIHNKIEKGITVLKVRGREHRGDIRPVIIDSQNGLRVRDIGWSMENLISGQTGEIKEPPLFVKFFYENESEDEIVEKAIEDFKSRYPSQTQFITKVRKPQIHIDYWSFGERRGPGHSNVKVFSISNYWAEAFYEKKRLHDLWEYIPKRIHDELEVIDDEFWKECRKKLPEEKEIKKGKRYNYFFIPHYADIGVLTFRKDVLKEFVETEGKEEKEKGEVENEEVENKKLLKKALEKAGIEIDNKEPFLISFDQIKDLFEALPHDIKSQHNIKYAFAMPALSEVPSFVAFFMETLWAYNGNLFKFPDQIPDATTGEPKEKGEAKPADFRKYVDDIFKEFIRLKESSIYKGFLEEIKKKGNVYSTRFNVYTEFKKYIDKKRDDPNFKSQIGEIDESIEKIEELIVIDRNEAVNALNFLKKWCSKEICGNPYLGDFSKESLFSRQWYSRINTVYEGLLLSKEERDKIEKEEENKQKRKERIREKILEQRKEKIGITFLPIVKIKEERKETIRCCTGYDLVCVGLIKESVSPETGWLLIDALMTPENIYMRSKYRWGLPAREEYYHREEFKACDEEAFSIAKKIRFKSDSKDSNVEIKYFGKIPYFAEIEGIIHRYLKDFFAQLAWGKDPESQKTLTQISEKIKNFIEEKVEEAVR